MSYYPTASSVSSSFNLFIPSSTASPRETHEMYQEFGFVLRPSNKQTVTSTGSKSSTLTSSTKSRSSLRKWLGTSDSDERLGHCICRVLTIVIVLAHPMSPLLHV
ncbi:hypothetical protein M413DRAFT_23859 [Hebeloma cylindrosporum]|uniref:Uncharacterized protein n=1 Tax=Hebeloma cylindrosporum TaxID=76867 RepID=A0A0C2Y8A7_HEBCY|nr:hypothetical protein M413DRAFT_23859 [Hebeloma cylindrosporum h7]